jgi:hypothetical protein
MSLRTFCVLLIAGLVVPTDASTGALAGGPAVSGPSAKFSVEGGQSGNDDSFLALGSYTMPLGTAFGLQADGAIGTMDDEVMGGGGLHLFTRDPSSYLLGVYGSYHTWDDIDIWRTAAEVELYVDRFSLSGLAGYESVDVPTTKNGLLVLNTDDDHFFGHAELAFYPIDNLKLSGGYRYVSETSLGTAGAEYLFQGAGAPISVFAKGDFGEDEFNSVTGGLKVYFGADPNKTLIRRHRTEDPQNYTPMFPQIVTQAPSSSPTPDDDACDQDDFDASILPSSELFDPAQCVCGESQLRYDIDGDGFFACSG